MDLLGMSARTLLPFLVSWCKHNYQLARVMSSRSMH